MLLEGMRVLSGGGKGKNWDICNSIINKIFFKNVHISQGNLQKQFNSHQNTSCILHRNRTNNPKVYMKLQRIPGSQSNFKEEEESRRHYAP